MTATIDWDALHTSAVEARWRPCSAPTPPTPTSPSEPRRSSTTAGSSTAATWRTRRTAWGLCAECTLVSTLIMTGGGKLVAFACVDGDEGALMPCGRCRQLLYEHSAQGMLLATVSGIKTIDEVLPDAFGPRTLAAYQTRHVQGDSEGQSD
jgi:cytidine deaminase